MENNTKLENIWLENARNNPKTIVLPEAGFSERIVKAGVLASNEKIAKIILLVKNDNELDNYDIHESEFLKVINITTHEIKEIFAECVRRGITEGKLW